MQAAEYLEGVALLVRLHRWEALQKLSATLDPSKHRDVISTAATALAGAGQTQRAGELLQRLGDHQVRKSNPNSPCAPQRHFRQDSTRLLGRL